MNKELIANLLVNSSKKTMLDVIENTDDIEFLKTEFTKTLNEKWDLQQERDKYKSIINKTLAFNNKCLGELVNCSEHTTRVSACILVHKEIEKYLKEEVEEGE